MKVVEPKNIFYSHVQRKTVIVVFSLLLYVLSLIVPAIPLAGIGANTAQATIAKYMNFQGKLTKTSDGTNVTNGSYAVEFKLYDALTSGTLLWTETYDQPSGVCTKLVVTSGVFNAKLGSCNSLAAIDFTGGALYLSVNFAPTGTSYDGEMAPRKQLVASPFAFVANSIVGDGKIDVANTTGPQATIGYDSSNKLQVSIGSTGSTTLTANGSGAAFLFSGGNLGVGGAATAKLQTTSTTEQLRVAYDASNYAAFTTSSGGNLTVAPSGGTLNITGTQTISSILQVGGATATTYSRLGTGTTSHSLSGANALLVSGSLEVDGSTFFDGTVAFGSTTTFQANDIVDAEVSDTLTSSLFVGSGSTTTAIDLATAEVSGTLAVGNGGTGVASTTAYGVILGGTTTTGAFQNAGTGNLGDILVSNGASAVATWQAVPACATCLVQVPTSTAVNTIQPTASGVVALTVNGSSNATGAVALNIAQTKDFANLTTTNTAKTSGNLISISHSTSAFTGTGLLMNIANGSGTFASGNFIDLQTNGSSKFLVDSAGDVIVPTSAKIGSSATNAYIQFQTSGNNLSVGLDGVQTANFSGTAVNGNQFLFNGSTRPITLTSGNTDGFTVNHTFSPTSGTATMSTLYVNPTINQTGGANGISRGLYMNPTLTSSKDFRGSDTVFTIAGAISGSAAYGQKISITNNQTTNANTVYGQHTSFTDAGSVANTLYGQYVDVTTANTADTTYAATFLGGNVGVGTASPTSPLHVTKTFTASSGTEIEANFVPTFNQTSSASAVGLAIQPTINQTSTPTGGYKALQINVTETALGSGTKLLIDAGTGGGSYTSKFNVSNTGAITSASLAGGGILCLQTDNNGVVSTAAAACGTGGGSSRLDQILAATADSTAQDSTNKQIAWNWSTLTTETAFKLQATGTGITSGALLNVTSATTGAVTNGIVQLIASGAYTGTGGLLNVTANSTTAGNVMNINANAIQGGTALNIVSTATTGVTGSLLGITSGTTTGAGNIVAISTTALNGTGSAIKVTGPSGATAVTNGLVQITAAGNYTGTGGLLNVSAGTSTAGTLASFTNNTASFTGNLISAAANGITSGKVLAASSSAAASFTGNLVDILLSDGTGASSNTGSLLMLTNSGTANANTALYVKHYATGTNNLAFRVDDVASDTSPFVIDGNGNVGIGVAAPTQKLVAQDGNILVNSSSSFTPTALSGADVSIGVNAVYVSGKYAYFGLAAAAGNDFRIYDIHNPNGATSVGGVDVSTDVRAVYVSGKYAYLGLTSDGGAGNEFRIYDISNPASPTVVGGISYNQNLTSIYIQGKLAFLGFAGDNSTGTELKIYDLGVPSAPVALGAVDTAGSSGGAGGIKSIYVQGKYAYLGLTAITGTCTGTGGTATGCELRTYDISDPLNPAYKAGVDVTRDVNTVAVSGKYAYTGFATDGSTANDFQIYNIADPTTAPSTVGGLDLSTGLSSLQVQGRYVYGGLVSATGNDFRIFDVSDPTTPTNIGGVDTTVDVNSVFASGKYVYTGLATVSGNDWRIYDVAGIDTPTLAVGSAGVGQLSVSDNARIENELTVGSSLNVGLGGIMSSGTIALENSVQGSGGNAVAGLFGNYTLTNSTASGFQYGNRFISTVNGGTAGTSIGTFMRMIDNTSLNSGQVVRGLEVQAYSGTNVNGTNTGIASFGYTFGIQGTTTSQAAAQAQPAAIFADLDNGTDSTTKTRGNAIRAYTNDATSADMVNIYQETSAYTGNLLLFDVANNSGTFASGNFINAKSAGTSLFHVNSAGNLFSTLRSTSTSAVCHVGTGAQTNDELTDCSGTPVADYAESYPVEHGVDYGDVVISGTQMVNTYDVTNDNIDWTKVKGKVTKLIKSTKAYQNSIIGVISDNHGDFSSTGYNIKQEDNPMPVALNGRVPVKTTIENGIIQPGDYLTSSATQPGFAMKATAPGMVIGQALAFFDGLGGNTVMVFVNPMFYDPTQQLDMTTNTINLQRGALATQLIATTTDAAAYLINQKGSGDILNVKNNDTSRLLVRNSGSTEINVTPSGPGETLFAVNSGNDKIFTINSKGSATIKGIIIIKDDTFAGSIATLEDGTAEVDFSYDLGTGKPVVQLTPESENPVFAQIASWKKDAQNNYVGFIIKSFNLKGGPKPVIVHYLVTGKQEDYNTFSTVALEVTSVPSGAATLVTYTIQGSDNSSPDQTPAQNEADSDADSNSTNGTVAGDSTDTTTPDASTTSPDAIPVSE